VGVLRVHPHSLRNTSRRCACRRASQADSPSPSSSPATNPSSDIVMSITTLLMAHSQTANEPNGVERDQARATPAHQQHCGSRCSITRFIDVRPHQRAERPDQKGTRAPYGRTPPIARHRPVTRNGIQRPPDHVDIDGTDDCPEGPIRSGHTSRRRGQRELRQRNTAIESILPPAVGA